MAEVSKTYEPKAFESDIYWRWEQSGFFNPDKLPDGKKRKPFVISMPPPNITGELHVGHALQSTVQDIFIRYHRMHGEAALWVPGTDHAAIATQVVVERQLREQGIDRQKIGREKFLKHVWNWKKKYGSVIIEQTKKMGASADWSREHFTMDENLTLAVNTAFQRLYKDGLIYRGERMVNWCPECKTAISDLEVDHQDTPGQLWQISYPLVDGSGQITVATTRPETMLGDTAIAVHPDDERYTAMIGKKVRVPIVLREIPVIADVRVEKGFGTGAVKVTPAHDPLDFDIGQAHKLPSIQVIGFDGKMTPEAGPEFVGLSTLDARRRVVERLRADNALVKEEDYIHAVACCSRSKTLIEPLVSLQWFVKAKPLAAKAIKAVKSGKVVILPKRFEKTFFQWMENIRDWNISRQIWWGHRLPVWYKVDKKGRMDIKASPTSPGKGWIQDEDTLDTWFSSGLWTFSTLGWPKKTSDLKRFHPTSVMVTGWDILFFWVARMMMLSIYLLGEAPFKTVYLTGLILDKDGKKMSKSKGTGLDPIPMTEKYGTDAVRMSLVIGNAPGQDFRIFEEKIAGYRNFANKLWNVARFVLTKPRPSESPQPVTLADQWILSRLQETIQATTEAINRYDLSTGGEALYTFLWRDFADWYIETSKIQPNPAILYYVLETCLRLLHPFMPFVTEAIWSQLYPSRMLMIEAWPKANPKMKFPETAAQFVKLQQTVVALRNFKRYGAVPDSTVGEFVGQEDPGLLKALSRMNVRIVDRLTVVGEYKPILLGHVRFLFPAVFVDQYETWRTKERQNVTRYIHALEKKLENRQFVAHAPADVVEQERKKLADAKQRLLEL